MILSNPFSDETRLLYLYQHCCLLCESNQGLELHHILGRVSSSPLNSILVCLKCHGSMSHNQEEHQKCFRRTLEYLWDTGYKITDDDEQFMRNHYKDLFTDEILLWLNNQTTRHI